MKGGDEVDYSKLDFDYLDLFKKIRGEFGSVAAFAEKMGVKPVTIRKKLRNESQWKNKEMRTAMELLGISFDEMERYFFTPQGLNVATIEEGETRHGSLRDMPLRSPGHDDYRHGDTAYASWVDGYGEVP